jgi:hypothetical protein
MSSFFPVGLFIYIIVTDMPGNIYRLIHGAFPYWPGYHPETPILARDAVEGQYLSRDDNQANMEIPMY